MSVGAVRLRWIGHSLRAECDVVVGDTLTVVEGHQIAEACEHRLLHDLPRLTAATVHADPHGVAHELTAHHIAR
jgi:divalent metal cation (Fe/Co/Zn/Cd) transporter